MSKENQFKTVYGKPEKQAAKKYMDLVGKKGDSALAHNPKKPDVKGASGKRLWLGQQDKDVRSGWNALENIAYRLDADAGTGSRGQPRRPTWQKFKNLGYSGKHTEALKFLAKAVADKGMDLKKILEGMEDFEGKPSLLEALDHVAPVDIANITYSKKVATHEYPLGNDKLFDGGLVDNPGGVANVIDHILDAETKAKLEQRYGPNWKLMAQDILRVLPTLGPNNRPSVSESTAAQMGGFSLNEDFTLPLIIGGGIAGAAILDAIGKKIGHDTDTSTFPPPAPEDVTPSLLSKIYKVPKNRINDIEVMLHGAKVRGEVPNYSYSHGNDGNHYYQLTAPQHIHDELQQRIGGF